MARGRATNLNIASTGRRIAAGIINVVVVMPPAVAATLGGLKVHSVVTGRKTEELKPDEFPPSWQRLLSISSPLLSIQSRNARSPGARLMRIRQADARTGGPVTIRSALVRYLIREWVGLIGDQLYRPVERRITEEQKRLEPEIQRIKDEHRDDDEARTRSLMQLYEDNDVNPLRSCGWRAIPGLVLNVPAYWLPRKQSLADRIAGIIVIET